MRIAWAAVLAATTWVGPVRAESPFSGMLALQLKGQTVEGTPLAWDASQVRLLGRDGRLWRFAPEDAARFQQTAERFQGYSPSELRATLLGELGSSYEVSGTGHYLVAHAAGQRDKWAPRFEDLYRSLVHYFSVRGLQPAAQPFLLVGIVCSSRRDFDRYAANHGSTAPSGVLGYYSLESNRIILYDLHGEANSQDWQENASVIIHEATHQTAFNTGIHSRYTPPPLWLAEGLAMLCEAPGVYDSRHRTRPGDRINRGRLREFRQLVEPQHRPELIAALVANDRLFGANPAAAYAEAWALSFYLAETQPQKYTKYLSLTAARPPFREYTPAQRTADFKTVFGDQWRMLEAQFLRFMAGVQ